MSNEQQQQKQQENANQQPESSPPQASNQQQNDSDEDLIQLSDTESVEIERKRILKLLEELPETGIQVPDPSDRTNRKAASKPGHIKRPLNAFMIFSMVKRREISNGSQHVLHKELSQSLGSMWKALSPAEKDPYAIEAERARLRHMYEHPYYRYKPKRKRNPYLPEAAATVAHKKMFPAKASEAKAETPTKSAMPIANQMFPYGNPANFMHQMYGGGGGSEARFTLPHAPLYPAAGNGFGRDLFQASLVAKAAQQLQQQKQEHQHQQQVFNGNVAAMIQAAMMYGRDWLANGNKQQATAGPNIAQRNPFAAAFVPYVNQHARRHEPVPALVRQPQPSPAVAAAAAVVVQPAPAAEETAVPLDFSMNNDGRKTPEMPLNIKLEKNDDPY